MRIYSSNARLGEMMTVACIFDRKGGKKRDGREDITADFTERKRTVMEYHKQPKANTLETDIERAQS